MIPHDLVLAFARMFSIFKKLYLNWYEENTTNSFLKQLALVISNNIFYAVKKSLMQNISNSIRLTLLWVGISNIQKTVFI